MRDRSDWPERYLAGEYLTTLAAEAGVHPTTVWHWLAARGIQRERTQSGEEDPMPYPLPLQKLILFYAEGSPGRHWMESRIAHWWAAHQIRD